MSKEYKELKGVKVVFNKSTGVSTYQSGMDVLVNGKFAYLSGGNGLKVFDISNPESPEPVGKLINTGALSYMGQTGMALGEGILYICGGNGRLRSFGFYSSSMYDWYWRFFACLPLLAERPQSTVMACFALHRF